MEMILRKTIKSGNASAVVLPKAWLNKNVKIELVDKTPEIMLYDVLSIIKSYLNLSEIIGIYLVGSYARKDQTSKSDIDILIVSEKTNGEVIKRENYEIMIISLDLLNYKLKENLLPIGVMLKEAKPLLNKHFLSEINVKITKENVKWYLETTKDRLNIIKDSIDRIEKNKPDGKLSDAVAYSLVLRLRTLYIINCLRTNKPYKKDTFVKLIKSISGSSVAYDRYIYAKENQENKRELPLIEGKRLYKYLKNYLHEIINFLK
ncbi:nucleotidyltransferase domain-containing protein [Candidatus Pacearchaeota archaeon]|nr:nucleotidyltransferase domain-containing protein [Candidatus Pacearchaeota archaeon]